MHNWFYAVVVSAKDELIFLDFENENEGVTRRARCKNVFTTFDGGGEAVPRLAKKYIPTCAVVNLGWRNSKTFFIRTCEFCRHFFMWKEFCSEKKADGLPFSFMRRSDRIGGLLDFLGIKNIGD